MGSGVPGAGTVVSAVDRQRLLDAQPVTDEMGKAEWQPEIGRDLRAVVGASQNPNLRRGRPGGLGADVAERMALEQLPTLQPRQQIAHIGRELVGCCLCLWVERIG